MEDQKAVFYAYNGVCFLTGGEEEKEGTAVIEGYGFGRFTIGPLSYTYNTGKGFARRRRGTELKA